MKNKNNIYILILLMFCINPLGLHAQQDSIPKQPGKRRFFFYPYTQSPAVIYNKISLFPNPAKDFVEIKMDEPKFMNYKLELLDLEGRRLLLQEWTGEKIDLSPFRSGIYLLKLSRDQETYSEKLLIKK